MSLNLRQTRPNGDFPLAVQACMGALSLILATLLLLAVRVYIPSAAGAGHLALTALFIAAIPGYYTLFSVLLKVYQGSGVQPTADR